ncbi:MAG TPA: hypothetical protein PLA94_19640, partial [Myxococcota bacterium]|nr:hypothetical protein [Myxococcota bacterium]
EHAQIFTTTPYLRKDPFSMIFRSVRSHPAKIPKKGRELRKAGRTITTHIPDKISTSSTRALRATVVYP